MCPESCHKNEMEHQSYCALLCPIALHWLLKSALSPLFIFKITICFVFWGVTTGLELAVDPLLPLTGRTRNQIRVVAANPHPAGKEVRIVSLTRWVGN